MGCDIHLYIEYKRKESKEYYPFGGRINPGRNYGMFGLLAKGVRHDNEKGMPIKGMPEYETIGHDARNDNLIFISETESDEYVTMETARRYESYGCKIINDIHGNPTWVEHPDWHSHSWLTTYEYKQQLEIYKSA